MIFIYSTTLTLPTTLPFTHTLPHLLLHRSLLSRTRWDVCLIVCVCFDPLQWLAGCGRYSHVLHHRLRAAPCLSSLINYSSRLRETHFNWQSSNNGWSGANPNNCLPAECVCRVYTSHFLFCRVRTYPHVYNIVVVAAKTRIKDPDEQTMLIITITTRTGQSLRNYYYYYSCRKQLTGCLVPLQRMWQSFLRIALMAD